MIVDIEGDKKSADCLLFCGQNTATARLRKHYLPGTIGQLVFLWRWAVIVVRHQRSIKGRLGKSMPGGPKVEEQ